MENEIWLRNNDSRSFRETRFKLCGWYSDKLWKHNGSEPLLSIVKFYKKNDGEWERCENGYFYVTLSDLLTNFIAIDSVFDKELNTLTEQVADTWKNNLENTFKINGTLGDPIKPEDIGVEVITPSEENIKNETN